MPKATKTHITESPQKRGRSSNNLKTCQAVRIHETMRGLSKAYNEVELTFNTEIEFVKDALRELFDARDAHEIF